MSRAIVGGAPTCGVSTSKRAAAQRRRGNMIPLRASATARAMIAAVVISVFGVSAHAQCGSAATGKSPASGDIVTANVAVTYSWNAPTSLIGFQGYRVFVDDNCTTYCTTAVT